MGIRTHKIEPHWNYLLAIERDLELLSRFIEFHEKNFDCFSIEIARILLAAAAETDVVCKQICKQIDANSTATNINQYRDQIKTAYPDIPQFEALLPRYGLTLRPWDEWTKSDGVPHWWTAYNKTKHERDSEYSRASLKNTLNAVAGLFIVVLYLYKEKARHADLLPPLQLLRPDERHFSGNTFREEYSQFAVNYNL